MTISNRPFGALADGTPVSCWTLTSETGLVAEVLDYGVTIRSVVVPDKNGRPTDVVLGYDTVEEYVAQDAYLGATVGRFANRIREGRFQLNGESYCLCINNGPNHLHGGLRGFDRYVWQSRQEEAGVVFTRLSPDGEEGYPGNLQLQVTIGWIGNALTITYDAQTDRDTILNLTNHSYFNLNGAGSGRIEGHSLQLNADRYTVCDENCTPTGELAPVEGTAMDFRSPKPIGRDVERDEPCVRPYLGYDSNFVLSGHPVAVAVGDVSGITLVADTDQPGVQLYTANYLTDRPGKQGQRYGFRSGFCLETQHFPDAINHPQWPSCILRPGERFHSTTSYAFF